MELKKNQSLICWDQRMDKDFDPPRLHHSKLIWALSLSLFLTFTSPGLAQEKNKLSKNSPPTDQTNIDLEKLNQELVSDLHISVAPRRSWANNKLNDNNHLSYEQYRLQQLVYESNKELINTFSDVLDKRHMEEMMRSCYKYYNFVDKIAQRLDFPTILILATFYIESSCELNNYDRYWVFQLTSSKKRYKVWKLSLAGFREQIVDFVEYSRSKYKYYEEMTWEKVILTHTNYKLKYIKIHWVMFNGRPKWITPDNSEYNVCNISHKRDCKKDWILASIVRIAKLFEQDFFKKYWLS